ncbi:MAG: glycosyltransferase family 4 protein [Chloroflexota bacterium]
MTGVSETARPLHVGLLTADLTLRHGWASYSLRLAEALCAQGVQLTIVAARNSPPLDGTTVLPLLPTLLPRERAPVPKQFLRLPQVRAALSSCDVIHATAEPYAPLAAAVAGSRPFFVTGHGSYVRYRRVTRPPFDRLYGWAYRRSTMICVSHYTARVAGAELPGLRTVVVNNGVDAARFAHLPPLDEPLTGPTVLSVGAVKARKGTLELVRAMAAVREQRPDAQCVIIGSLEHEPGYVARVRAEIERLGLRDAVRLLGHLPERTMLAWYGAARVFVLPSINAGWKFEGFGLTLMEASAAGLPVIGTRDCGAEDAVVDGVTGLLVSQRDLETTLPGAILRLLDHPDEAARMGAAGQARARSQTWDRVAEQVIRLYRQA